MTGAAYRGRTNLADRYKKNRLGPLSLTAANIANAVGVAVASVLFLRWLNYYGLSGSVLPVYTQWAQSPEVFIEAFQSSWLVIAGLTAIAVVTSVLRGVEKGKDS